MTHPTRDPGYSPDDIAEVLARHLQPDQVRAAMGDLASRRAQQNAEQLHGQYLGQVLDFGIAYQRLADPEHSPRGLHGWWASLHDSADGILAHMEGRTDASLSDLDRQARETAAVAIALHHLGTDGRSLSGSKDGDLISRAGVSEKEMLAWVRRGARESGVDKRFNTKGFSLDDFAMILPDPDIWDRVVSPRADRLLETMRDAGFILPPLNDRLEYGSEDDPDRYDLWDRSTAVPHIPVRGE